MDQSNQGEQCGNGDTASWQVVVRLGMLRSLRKVSQLSVVGLAELHSSSTLRFEDSIAIWSDVQVICKEIEGYYVEKNLSSSHFSTLIPNSKSKVIV